ncbi:MAG: hypothetical protein RLW62_18795, partial [Gammaproteobacteria bacterium]
MSAAARSFPLALVLACLLAAPAQAASADLEQALSLLGSGQAEQAYELLAAAEEANAGNPDFDYLLGLAALDSGR